MADLTMGPDPDDITLRLYKGERWDSALDLIENGVPVKWPVAPVMAFEGAVWTAVLSEDGTRATWSRSVSDVAAVIALPKRGVRLQVDGISWWRGVVKIYD